jgi:hypothetical protein
MGQLNSRRWLPGSRAWLSVNRRRYGLPGSSQERQLTQRRKEARTQRAGRREGKDGLESLSQRVKLPRNRNPCVLAPLRLCVAATAFFGFIALSFSRQGRAGAASAGEGGRPGTWVCFNLGNAVESTQRRKGAETRQCRLAGPSTCWVMSYARCSPRHLPVPCGFASWRLCVNCGSWVQL